LLCLSLSCIPTNKNKAKTIQRIDNIGYTRQRQTKQK
jgi:hypothetical protein